MDRETSLVSHYKYTINLYRKGWPGPEAKGKFCLKAQGLGIILSVGPGTRLEVFPLCLKFLHFKVVESQCFLVFDKMLNYVIILHNT